MLSASVKLIIIQVYFLWNVLKLKEYNNKVVHTIPDVTNCVFKNIYFNIKKINSNQNIKTAN